MSPPPPLLSVAVVTFGRAPLLPLLLEQFDAQRYPCRELVVLDDSPAPCSWLQQLGRPDVRYVYDPPRRSVGSKRNRMLELTRGPWISQWDDDDYYAPGYLDFVAFQLAGADFVKLDRWFVHTPAEDSFALWDTRRPPAGPPLPPGELQRWVDLNRLGYGFTFSYRREVLEAVQSPDSSVGDDHAFARAVVERGFRVRLLPDQQGLALHLLHGRNLSRCFPTSPLQRTHRATLFPGFDRARYREALAQLETLPPPPR